jgi:hypothetical protein
MNQRLAIVLVCAILAACTTSGGLTVSATTAASTAPTTSSAYIATQSVAASLLIAGLLAAAWYGGDGVTYVYGGHPRWDIWAPPLDEARSVHVQDCTRPMENPTANLRCR